MSRTEIILRYLKKTKSGWWNFIEEYTDGSFMITHGTHNRSYTKILRRSNDK